MCVALRVCSLYKTSIHFAQFMTTLRSALDKFVVVIISTKYSGDFFLELVSCRRFVIRLFHFLPNASFSLICVRFCLRFRYFFHRHFLFIISILLLLSLIFYPLVFYFSIETYQCFGEFSSELESVIKRWRAMKSVQFSIAKSTC